MANFNKLIDFFLGLFDKNSSPNYEEIIKSTGDYEGCYLPFVVQSIVEEKIKENNKAKELYILCLLYNVVVDIYDKEIPVEITLIGRGIRNAWIIYGCVLDRYLREFGRRIITYGFKGQEGERFERKPIYKEESIIIKEIIKSKIDKIKKADNNTDDNNNNNNNTDDKTKDITKKINNVLGN